MTVRRNRLSLHHVIVDLERQWELLPPRAARRRLWILCADATVDAAVRQIRRQYNDLVLRVPGGELGDDAITDTILARLLHHFPLHEILLCGHSECTALPPLDTMPSAAARRGRYPLLLGAMRRVSRTARCRNRLVQQLARLQAGPQVKHAKHLLNVEIVGMFYLDESGVFSRYNERTDQFTAVPH